MAEKLWVSQYMREQEKDRRREILEQAIAEEGMLPDNELREKLWKARYRKQGGREVDTFVRGLMNLMYIDNVGQGFFARKRVEQEKQKILEDWQMALAAQYGETGKQVLYEELFNTVRLFMLLCEDDKTYGSVLLGLGHMNKEKLTAKIARDVFRMAYEIPRRHGISKEVAVFTKAATDAYCEMYDRRKNLLLDLIHTRKEEE